MSLDAKTSALADILNDWMTAEAQKLRDAAPRSLGRWLARSDMADIYVAEWRRLRALRA